MLSYQELVKHLSYDPATGIFQWRVRRNGAASDLIAGWPVWNGYLMICLLGKKYRAHRLAWFYMIGEWPIADVDHINGARSDNRWENLRAASRSQNLMNMGRRSDNTSGIKGVCFDKARGLFMAQICKEGKRHHLGRFETAEMAQEAYVAAAYRLFGEFARVS